MNDWIELGSAIADGRGLRRAAYSSVCRRPDLELNEATITAGELPSGDPRAVHPDRWPLREMGQELEHDRAWSLAA
jgi:hypothetical protein